MNVGELFLNLGIRGSDKTIGAITDVKKGLGGVASESLAAKASIVGAMYALEHLFATSGKAGTGLTNFNSLIGVSTKTLQQYQYAARQMGVTNEETAATFKGLQSTITKTLMGEGAPKGLARVALLTGGLNAQDMKKFAEQPQLLIQKLQQYAQRETNVGLRNEVLKSFGVGEGMAAALARQAFKPSVLAHAPGYSEREITQLDRANIAWSNLGNKIEMAVGHFNAMHGGKLVHDFDMIVTSAIHAAEAFQRLSEKLHLFETGSQFIEGVANSMKLISEVIDKVGGKESKKGDLLYTPPGQEMIPGLAESPVGKFVQGIVGYGKPEPTGPVPALPNHFPMPALASDQKKKLPSERTAMPALPHARDIASPKLPATTSKTTTQNVNVNQTNNFEHAGTDPLKVADSHKKSIKEAFRQMPSLGEGP